MADPTITPHGASAYPAATSERPADLHRTDDRSLGEILGDLTANVSVLVRQELALAKAELQQSAKRAGTGAGLLAGAGVAGHLALIFASFALWWWIAHLINANDPAYGWSFLIVTLIWVIVAAILAATGRKQLNEVQGVPKTTETVSKIPNALKGDEEKNA